MMSEFILTEGLTGDRDTPYSVEVCIDFGKLSEIPIVNLAGFSASKGSLALIGIEAKMRYAYIGLVEKRQDC